MYCSVVLKGTSNVVLFVRYAWEKAGSSQELNRLLLCNPAVHPGGLFAFGVCHPLRTRTSPGPWSKTCPVCSRLVSLRASSRSSARLLGRVWRHGVQREGPWPPTAALRVLSVTQDLTHSQPRVRSSATALGAVKGLPGTHCRKQKSQDWSLATRTGARLLGPHSVPATAGWTYGRTVTRTKREKGLSEHLVPPTGGSQANS